MADQLADSIVQAAQILEKKNSSKQRFAQMFVGPGCCFVKHGATSGRNFTWISDALDHLVEEGFSIDSMEVKRVYNSWDGKTSHRFLYSKTEE